MPVEQRVAAPCQSHGTLPHRSPALNPDQTIAHRILPCGHFGACGGPRLHDLAVGARTVGDPGHELQRERVHCADMGPGHLGFQRLAPRPLAPLPSALSKLSDIAPRMVVYCVDSCTISVAYGFYRQDLSMLYSLMLLGIGFLTACLFLVMLAPLIHERAVRLTVRRLSSKRPRSATDQRAHEDQMRAQFAVEIRRLETAVEDAKGKTAIQHCDVGKKLAEIHHLKTELRKRNIVILRFQARELMRRSITRTIIKVLVYLFARSKRQSERAQAVPVFRGRDVRKSELGTISAQNWRPNVAG
jgi:hypothetical protein